MSVGFDTTQGVVPPVFASQATTLLGPLVPFTSITPTHFLCPVSVSSSVQATASAALYANIIPSLNNKNVSGVTA